MECKKRTIFTISCEEKDKKGNLNNYANEYFTSSSVRISPRSNITVFSSLAVMNLKETACSWMIHRYHIL